MKLLVYITYMWHLKGILCYWHIYVNSMLTLLPAWHLRATECSTHIASESDCKLMHFAMHLNLMVFIPQVLSDTMQAKGLIESWNFSLLVCAVIWVVTTLLVHWDICMQCGRHICSWTYAHYVRSMYTSSFIHIIDCSESYEVYILTYLSDTVHELIGICNIWGAYLFLAHILQ